MGILNGLGNESVNNNYGIMPISGSGTPLDAIMGGTVDLLSTNGEGDTTMFSQLGQTLNELEKKANQGLANYMLSDKRAQRYEKLLGIAENIDAKGIPEKIHEGLSNFREKVLTSPIFGEVVGGVLEVVYNIGSQLPIIGGIVSAVSSMITPNDVKTVINNTLNHIETDFFDKIESNEDYQKYREKMLEAFSLSNIVKVTHNMANTGLAAGIVATPEGASTQDVIAAIKAGKEQYIEGVKNGTYDGISEATPYLAGTTKAVIGATLNTTKNIVTDEGVKSMGSSIINGIPGLISAGGDAVSEVMGMASSLSGSLGGIGSIGNLGGSLGSMLNIVKKFV